MKGSVAETREAAREGLRVKWRARGWYSDLTVGDALTAGAVQRPEDRLVFAAADGRTEVATLSSLYRRASKLAAGLLAVGVVPGDSVVVQATANARSTEVLEALWLLGTVVVPVSVTCRVAEMSHIVTESGARHVIVTPEWRGVDLATQVVEHQRDWGLTSVLALGDDGPPGSVPTGSLGARGTLPEARSRPASVCCVLYTSGSTAAPKGVEHSHETLLAGLTPFPVEAPSGTLMTFPSGHVASLLGLLRPLSVGGTTVVMDRWSAREAARLVEEYRPVHSAGTPFFLGTLLDEADRSGRDISSLQRFLVGAASVPPSLVRRAEKRGIISWRTYGSTEHPAISSGRPDDPPEKRQLTDGRVVPGNEVRVIDEYGRDVPRGDEGEILARGPKQFLGYRNNHLDDEAFVDTSWFRTGDLGRIDADGYLVVTDRVKEIIVRGGENISGREVEDALATHSGIQEVAVCAVPDDTWGERVCAFVIARPGRHIELADLAGHIVSSGLAAHKAPAQLVLVDKLPRTGAGKIRKRELRGVAATGQQTREGHGPID